MFVTVGDMERARKLAGSSNDYYENLLEMIDLGLRAAELDDLSHSQSQVKI